MLTERDITALAEFMGWHLVQEFVDGDYLYCWASDEDGQVIPADWWNPDSDMTDAWMLVDRVQATPHKAVFEGYLAAFVTQEGEEIQMRPSIYRITPEVICKAALACASK